MPHKWAETIYRETLSLSKEHDPQRQSWTKHIQSPIKKVDAWQRHNMQMLVWENADGEARVSYSPWLPLRGVWPPEQNQES